MTLSHILKSKPKDINIHFFVFSFFLISNIYLVYIYNVNRELKLTTTIYYKKMDIQVFLDSYLCDINNNEYISVFVRSHGYIDIFKHIINMKLL